MKTINKILLGVLVMVMTPLGPIFAQQSGLNYRPDLGIEVWTNKGEGETFYRGEDLVVYFRADHNCYALIYEIDTDGNINVIFPSGPGEDAFVNANSTYRIPPLNADYHMEVGGAEGDEYIYAIASNEKFSGPQWMVYWGIEYNRIEDEWIVDASGGRNNALDQIIGRLVSENGGRYVSASVSFNIEASYRNYFYYPSSQYNYRYGSAWIGADYPGCEIFIDGIYYGIAPLYIPSILAGGHIIILYYGGYPCWQNYFWVDYGNYYRFNAVVEYRYIVYRDSNVRYKYWGDWDFGGKDYRRDKRYKDWGGYTYKNPEAIWTSSKSHYKNSAGTRVKDYDRNGVIEKSEFKKSYKNPESWMKIKNTEQQKSNQAKSSETKKSKEIKKPANKKVDNGKADELNKSKIIKNTKPTKTDDGKAMDKGQSKSNGSKTSNPKDKGNQTDKSRRDR